MRLLKALGKIILYTIIGLGAGIVSFLILIAFFLTFPWSLVILILILIFKK